MKRYGLSKKEKIKKRKEFEAVYSHGDVLFSENKKFKVNYLFFETESQPVVKVAFGVSRKAGNAVWRNRVKRLMRESYRLNKHPLLEISSKKKVTVLAVFSPNSINKKKFKKIYLQDVQPEIKSLLGKIKEKLK